MSDALKTFFAAWATGDADKVRAAMAVTFLYADPQSPVAMDDADALTDHVSNFAANAPGWTADVIKADHVQGYMRATVRFSGPGPDGSEMAQQGQYFARTDAAGRLTLLVGFAGTGEPK